MRLTSLALPTLILVALAGTLPAIEPTTKPVSRDGTPAIVDLPAGQHMRNTGGMGPRGAGTGAGLCVFTSCEIASRWQNTSALTGFQKWMTTKPGGGDPRKLQQMITAFCKEKGVVAPDYVQHTGGDMAILDTGLKTRRLVCVTYAGMDDFYRGGIDHMVCLAHLDATHAAIIDNNRPGNWVWMTRAEFETRWKARGGGWAVIFLDSPPPPAIPGATVKQHSGCVCGDQCGCAKGDCPAKCPVLHLQPGQRFFSPPQSSCPGGNCPAPGYQYPQYQPYQPTAPVAAAPPATGADKFVDRSSSSLLVTRTLGGGVSESGTGTVIGRRDRTCYVLTNAHVAEDATKPISVTTRTGTSYPAKYVAGSKVTHTGPNTITVDGPDLALLSVAADLPVAPVAETQPAVGTAVCQWGYGGVTSGAPKFKSGSTLDQANFVGAIQRSTIPSQNGDSGSGVFDATGNLVAVCWGGTDGTEFAVRLDAVREFIRLHVPPAMPPPPAIPAAEEDEAPNHGINRTELDKHTRDGKHTYWINGREVGRPQALDVVAAGGLGLVDDSDRYHLSIVASDAAAVRTALADPRLAAALGKVHVQVYSPTDWPVTTRGLKPGATLQEPAPKGGKLVWSSATVDVAGLADGLKRADPAFTPDPPPPVMPAPQPPPVPVPVPMVPPAVPPIPVDPAIGPPANPNDSKPAQPAPAQPTLALLVAGAALFFFLRRS